MTLSSTELKAEAESAALARKLIRETLTLDSMRYTEADLLVTELVGNVIRHSSAETFTISVEKKPHTGEISVDHPHTSGLEEATPGVGFLILSRVSGAWGHHFDAGVLSVWFSLRTPGAISIADELSDADLFDRMNEGEASYSDELVRRHSDLAISISKRYKGKGIPEEDLEQVSLMALLKAIQRFNPELGDLRAYAAATVSGEMKKFLRDSGWSLRVPRSLQEDSLAVTKTLEELGHRLDREPTIEELAQHLGWSEDEVGEALQARKAYQSRSIDAPSPQNEIVLAQRLGELDPRLASSEDRVVLEDAIASLPKRQREILDLRFNEDLTQSEIAQIVGISQMHVSRLLGRSLEALRSELG